MTTGRRPESSQESNGVRISDGLSKARALELRIIFVGPLVPRPTVALQQLHVDHRHRWSAQSLLEKRQGPAACAPLKRRPQPAFKASRSLGFLSRSV